MSEMRSGSGNNADTEARCQPGQRRVAFVVERVTMMGQFDADPAGREPVHQIGQCPFRRVGAAIGKGLAYSPFPAASQDMPVSAGRLGQRVDVVAQLALLTAG